MSVPRIELDRIISIAKIYEAQGYFERARAGDKKASSLFARLCALDANPTGKEDSWGWLTKVPPESNEGGFGDDAVCWTNDASNLLNVADIVNGAGAPNASIPSKIDPKERREHNKWYKPETLTMYELAYLRAGGMPPTPQPPQPPATPSYPYPDENTTVKAYQDRVKKAYNDAGRQFPDPNDSDAFRHFCRYGYDCKSMPEPESAKKHIAELRQALGVPPE